MKVIDGGTKRKYYKWGSPNVSIVGSPTNNDGVFSGFSASNYLQLPQNFKPGSTPWEMVWCVEDMTTSLGFIFSSGLYGTDQYTTGVNVFANLVNGQAQAGYASASLGFGYPNNYHNIYGQCATSGVQYIKVEFTGSAYNFYVSNTSTFSDTPNMSWASSTPVSAERPANRIGVGPVSNSPYQGKLRLKECYIKIGGGYWWQGYTIVEGTESDYDWYEDVEVKKLPKEVVRKYYKYGTTLNDQIIQSGGTYSDGVFTGASGAHLLLPVLPITTANSWEIQTVYTYNGGGTYPTVIAPSTSGYGLQLVIINGDFYVSATSDGTTSSMVYSQSTGVSASLNTTYYIKYGFTGTQYYFEYNTDGSDNYTRAWTYSSSVKTYTETAHYLMDWGLGSNRWSAGSINMEKTKIYINGVLFLAGTNPEPATESDYDFYKDVDIYYAVRS